MIRKTVKLIKRKTISGSFGDIHIERLVVETWWLLFIIPLYSRQTIIESNQTKAFNPPPKKP